MEKFDEKCENIDFILEALSGKNFKKISQNETRICPACKSKMVKNFASARHEIEIDSCYSCGGKFLDCGELEALRKQFDTDQQRSADFHQDFINQYSQAILANERETQRLEKERFIFGHIFNALYNVRKSSKDKKLEKDRKDLKEMVDLMKKTY